MKRCIYCRCDLSEGNIIDFCERCGREVWGDKMLNAIVQNMKEANKRGDLDQSKM